MAGLGANATLARTRRLGKWRRSRIESGTTVATTPDKETGNGCK